MESPVYNLLVDLHRHFTPRNRRSRTFIFSAVLLDICLLTLGFHLITGRFILQPGIRISLPQSAFADGVLLQTATVAITRDGRLFHDDSPVEPDDLTALLKTVRRRQPELRLLIQADRNVRYERLIDLCNRAAEAGIYEIVLAVRPEATAGSR